MFVYWLMYLLPFSLILFLSGRKQHHLMPWIIVGLIFIILIGLRHEVGGDWFNYLRHYQRTLGVSIEIALSKGDPGYVLFNWLMASLGWGIYGVNLIAGTIFVVGLSAFCRQQEKPWLAFTVAVPYLIVVVAMGYTRQAVAVGLFFWAISYLEQGKLKYYLVLVIIAALFHKAAILMIPLGLFLYGKGKFVRIIAVTVIAYGMWDLLLANHQQDLWKNYVEAQMQSEGAKIRVLMNLVPSLFLLLYWRQWKRIFPNFWFWFWIAIGSVISVVLVDFASTAVDRIALYFIPIQVAVFSRLPLLASKHISPKFITFGIVAGYAAVLFVWLNYASHARYWLPYQNALFL